MMTVKNGTNLTLPGGLSFDLSIFKIKSFLKKSISEGNLVSISAAPLCPCVLVSLWLKKTFLYDFHGHKVWGATAMVLAELREILYQF